MIYVYAPRWAVGAPELTQALKAERLKRFDGMDFWNKTKRFTPEDGSVIICCGASLPELDGVRVLNSMEVPLTKVQEYTKFTLGKVNCLRYNKPDGFNAPEMYVQSGYIPRMNNTSEGMDILVNKPGNPDYYTLKETFSQEFRIHSFGGRSIRAGQKVAMKGLKTCHETQWRPNANMLHPWVRTRLGGWDMNYEGFASTPAMRELAHKAVKVLGLTFGAVDIAQRQDGTLIVVGVKTSFEAEEGTLNAYVRAILRWIKKEETDEAEGREL